ncbi:MULTISPECIES: SIMPL domain-containing protein [unclassified Janthinobacterium]|uniref:SIMPL domain-containing protein n=1 Tax=unclassified Janthinobacterium TaxID=2610881 RepID=UPI00161869EF|nr:MULTISPECIES: SIMPL domain-containing protein [unclassified Janthinobacterium]MBB5610180.1 putative secreted protein [Janthinobacterium sp. S3T4]MBB5615470.1 putative secreted protein [Janthinobacterium sp. S3M3]
MTVMKTMLAAAALATVTLSAQAQSLPTAGTLVVVPANGEVVHANDQVTVTLAIEEQDKDKAAAASRVNQKMSQGVAIVKQADPQAVLKTQGYYTYAVYPEATPLPAGSVARPRVPTGWRVGQYLQVTTTNLAALPKTVSAAQSVLTLNRLNFGLAPATVRKLDEQRIVAAYQNLNQRVAAIAAAMGRNLSDAVIDTIDFEGSGNFAQRPTLMAARSVSADAMAYGGQQVAEPSFEPGETTLSMGLVAKVKFK